MAEVFVFGAVTATVKYLVHYINGMSRPKSAVQVGRVKAINLYPCKSMAGISLQDCLTTSFGLSSQGVRDRQWMLVTAANHTFITARAQPKLVTIVPSFHDDGVHLDAPDMPTLVLKKNLQVKDTDILKTKVWGQDISGLDVGDEAAAWIEKYLGKAAGTYRLIYHSDQLDKRVLVWQNDIWQQQCKLQDAVQYQDGFPYLLISAASVTALNSSVQERCPDTPALSIKQFRPNIEVEGCDAYAEDTWKDVYIGEDTKFSNKKPCGRCVMTTVDTDVGKKNPDGEPLKTLKLVRPHVDDSPAFGINLVLDKAGVIAVGQPVYAAL